jgi:hypothetical protein
MGTLMSNRKTIARYARMFGAGFALTIATTAMLNAQEQRDDALDQVATLTATLDHQQDVSADYADQVAGLTDQLADAQQENADLRAQWSDQIVMSSDAAPEDVARGKSRAAMWEGFTVGEVIVCPKGWTASVDQVRGGKGQTWAACM